MKKDDFIARWNRREVLEGLMGSPFLLTSFALFLEQSLRTAAIGQSRQAVVNNLVDIYWGGGNLRHHFDMLFRGYNQPIAEVPGHATTYENNRMVHKTISAAGGLQLPPAWGINLDRPGGGSRRFSDHLGNFVCIRGANPTDGHEINFMNQYVPIAGQSLIGSILRQQNAMVAPIVHGSVDQRGHLRSQAGPAMVGGGGGMGNVNSNVLRTIFTPFLGASSYLASFQGLIQQSASLLIASGLSGSQAASASYAGTQGLLEAAWMNPTYLFQTWTSLYNKYNNLFNAIHTNNIMHQIFQEPIPMGIESLDYLDGQDNERRCIADDARLIINAQSNIRDLANAFAVAEFGLVHGVSSVAAITVHEVRNLLIPQVRDYMDQNGTAVFTGTRQNVMVGVGGDAHGIGQTLSMVAESYKAVSVMTGLNALIESLEAKGIWQDTLVTSRSEFLRNMRHRVVRAGGPLVCEGYDHGWEGFCAGLLSGAFQGGDKLIGNIAVGNPMVGLNGMGLGNGHIGTFGAARPTLITGRGAQRLYQPMINETIAALLGCRITTELPLLTVNSNGAVAALTEPARNIA